ncbi:hypothetical protein CaCOL14_003731 [Colletotrichum acutatum]
MFSAEQVGCKVAGHRRRIRCGAWEAVRLRGWRINATKDAR